ncbi:MAG: MBL fold metallo-hydrolase [Solirubrobacterales bacterium]
MELTVLGKSPAWADAGGACSGYLVQDDGSTVLLEAGNGVFAKLRARVDFASVDAVLISHMHADHILDLVPFAYGLTLSPRLDAEGDARPVPTLYVPPGGRKALRALTGAWESEDLIESAFAIVEYDPVETVAVGSLRFNFREVPHFTQTFAIEATSVRGGGRITYGADCRADEALVEFARSTDVMLLEATLLEADPDPEAGHMTAAEAGEQAQRAGARRLVLTHFSDELDAERMRRDAGESFDGPLELAQEGAVYSV